MENKQKLSLKSKISYGLGAVGKDMVYMLSASYVLYYFQDLLGVNAIAMAEGAVAQPVRVKEYGAERIPLSNAIAIELFYSYGTKAVAADLIQVYGSPTTTTTNCAQP